jgi:hypothetical protein
VHDLIEELSLATCNGRPKLTDTSVKVVRDFLGNASKEHTTLSTVLANLRAFCRVSSSSQVEGKCHNETSEKDVLPESLAIIGSILSHLRLSPRYVSPHATV